MPCLVDAKRILAAEIIGFVKKRHFAFEVALHPDLVHVSMICDDFFRPLFVLIRLVIFGSILESFLIQEVVHNRESVEAFFTLTAWEFSKSSLEFTKIVFAAPETSKVSPDAPQGLPNDPPRTPK